MSGRRRRDDGWDDGRRDGDAQDGSRPGPWLDGGADDRRSGGYPAPSFQPLGSSANGYGAAGAASASDGAVGSNGSNGYGAANGYGAGNGYQDSGYGRADSGYGRGGYDTAGYDQTSYGTAGYAARGGGSGAADYSQSGYGASYATEFMPADPGADDAAHDAATGTPRPIGRLSIYTLLDDKDAEFDRVAERAAEGVRSSEPDTLVYVIHVVPKAPMQRIIYEIYRDRAAFESHERQPHIRRFTADRASCVLATNVIDLRLKYAKVAALGGGPAASSAAQSQDAGQYGGGQQDTRQYSAGQYDTGRAGSGQYAGDQPAAATRTQYPAAAAAVASFTQADNGYAGAVGQTGAASQYATAGVGQYGASGSGEYAAAGSGQYAAAASGQYAAAGSGQYAAAGSGQYDAAGSGQYAAAGAGQYAASGAAAVNGANGQYGYAGGGYDATSGQYSAAAAYPATSAYNEAGSYPSATGYQPAADYPPAGGYAGGTVYSGAGGYQAGDGYASDGYASANGNAGSSGYSGTASGAYFTPAGPASGQYPDSGGRAIGGQTAGGQTAGAQAPGDQQAGGARRYRELGAAPTPAADGASGAHQAAGDAAGSYSARDYDYAGRDRDGTAEWAPPGYSNQGYR